MQEKQIISGTFWHHFFYTFCGKRETVENDVVFRKLKKLGYNASYKNCIE